MYRQIVLPVVFVLMILAQLYVPGKMIWDSEQIWLQGTTHLFKTAPVDPVDIFRGKYINLYFQGTIIQVDDESEWVIGEQVFGLLVKDEAGFSQIEAVSKEKPQDGIDYITLSINYVTNDGKNKLHLDYPFDRFYMEETKAYQAELSYNESQRDSSSSTYVVVAIRDGDAVIKDVLINGVPIKEVAQTAGTDSN